MAEIGGGRRRGRGSGRGRTGKGNGTTPQTIDELASRRAARRTAGQPAYNDEENTLSRGGRLDNRRRLRERKVDYVLDHPGGAAYFPLQNVAGTLCWRTILMKDSCDMYSL